MWGLFCVAAVVALVLLLFPGTVILRALRCSWPVSVALAAPLTVFLAQILFVLADAAGIRVGINTFLVPVGLVLLVIGGVAEVRLLLRRRKRVAVDEERADGGDAGDAGDTTCRSVLKSERWWIGPTFLLAIIATGFLFIKNLDGPASYSEHYDTAWHYSVVTRFLRTGQYSAFGSASVVPTVGSHFYPTGWHALVTLVSLVTGAQVPLAANAVNAVLVAAVYPLENMALMWWLFRKDRRFAAAGGVAGLLFAPFPWRFLSFGPLYSNLFSFVLLPVLLLECLAVLDVSTPARLRWKGALLLVCSAGGLVFSQPNALFTAAVILIPYCAGQIPLYIRQHCEDSRKALIRSVVAEVAVAVLTVGMWVGLYRAPFMQRTVTFNWPKRYGVKSSLSEVLILGFQQLPQPLLGLLVVMGIGLTLLHRKWLWLTVSYAVFWVFYLLSAATEGEWKHLLTGFWYTDQYRLAASAVFPAIPLAAMGLVLLVEVAEKLFGGVVTGLPALRGGGPRVPVVAIGSRWSKRIVAVFVTILVVVSSYSPSLSFGQTTLQQGFDDVTTGIVQSNDMNNDAARIYTQEKSAFVRQVRKIVGTAMVVNQPFDGSCFSYSLEGVNVYYKALDGNWMGHPTKDSLAIMHGMGRVKNPAVRTALRHSKARYFMLLDNRGVYRKTSDPQWVQTPLYGIGYSLHDWGDMDSLRSRGNIPGMRLVFQQGRNRLYQIRG